MSAENHLPSAKEAQAMVQDFVEIQFGGDKKKNGLSKQNFFTFFFNVK